MFNNISSACMNCYDCICTQQGAISHRQRLPLPTRMNEKLLSLRIFVWDYFFLLFNRRQSGRKCWYWVQFPQIELHRRLQCTRATAELILPTKNYYQIMNNLHLPHQCNVSALLTYQFIQAVHVFFFRSPVVAFVAKKNNNNFHYYLTIDQAEKSREKMKYIWMELKWPDFGRKGHRQHSDKVDQPTPAHQPTENWKSILCITLYIIECRHVKKNTELSNTVCAVACAI